MRAAELGIVLVMVVVRGAPDAAGAQSRMPKILIKLSASRDCGRIAWCCWS